MPKDKKDYFVLELELNTNYYHQSQIEKRLEVARQIQNTCLGLLLKRYNQMIRTKKHQKLKRQLIAVNKKLDNKSGKFKNEIKLLEKNRKQLIYELVSLSKEYRLTKIDAEKDMIPVRNHFDGILDSQAGQKAAERAFIAFEKLLTGKSKKVKFISKNNMVSFEGKWNKSGIRFKDNQVFLTTKISIPVIIKKNDLYAMESLTLNIIKYCRIIKKVIRGNNRYYVQLIMEGFPPPKRNKDGSFRKKLGIGKVGIDIGTQSVGVVGENNVLLNELSPQTNRLDKQLWLIDRKMDRSRRAKNPQNYNENGTIKKGSKKWLKSNRYKKLQLQRRELFRKQSVKRKQSHNETTNYILSFGDAFYIEPMNFKGLQKRSKKTEISEKTGKFKKKKRFGKSLSVKAPSMFVSLLKQKVESFGGVFEEITSTSYKASQYNHMTGECIKKPLSQRWHKFDNGIKVQRDLYSAFLLMNSNDDKKTPNQDNCLKTFDKFLEIHNEEVKKIVNNKIKVKNSGIKF